MTNHVNGHQNQDDEDIEIIPELIPSKVGRTVSRFGLVERIIEQFELEHGEGKSEAIQQSTSEVERRKLVRDVANYIFGVESVQLSPSEQASIIGAVYAELFGYGPLDKYFADESITTIALEGSQKIGIRYGVAQELEILNPIFENTPHMQRTISRLLRDASVEIDDDTPIIETGLVIAGRRVALNMAIPPFVPELSVDIRLHPKQPFSLDDWLEQGIINKKVQELLEAIVESKHGLLIVGDTESGKTTLLSMLLRLITDKKIVTVERSGEINVPDGISQLTPQWGGNGETRVSFGEQIIKAIEKDAHTIVLDEVRNDEPQSIAPLLSNDDIPRQIWSFRGTSEPKRLKSSLSMLARMAGNNQSEAMVTQLYKRLPFVVLLKRRKGQLKVREIAEWQFSNDADYADYVPLVTLDWDDYKTTGRSPQNLLDLPENFWQILD